MPNQELIDVIIKPENIHCAWDIADAINDVNNRLRCNFWYAVAESLKKGLANAAHARGWVVAGLEETCRNPNKTDAGVYFTAPNSAALRVGVWQESKHVFNGVGFTTKQPDPHPLQEKLEALQGVLPEGWRKNALNSSWIGWAWTPVFTESREFLFSALTDADTLAQAVAGPVIGVLSDQARWQRIVEANNVLGG
jgi:hypothetical protein